MTDLSTRIVGLAARLLPAERQEWGAAMKAELTQIDDRRARLSFAGGCARASLFAPRRPDMTAGTVTATIVLAGVAGCITMTAFAIAQYPIAAQDLSLARSLSFAAVLAGYCWIALLPPRVLVASRRAVRVGTIAGLALYLGVTLGDWIVDAVVSRERASTAGDALFFLSIVGTFMICSAIVAARERSFRSGLAVAAWAGMVNAVLGFGLDLLATVQGWNLEAHVRGRIGPLPDLDHFLIKHIGEHLSTSMRNLGAYPMLALLLGAMGTGCGIAWQALTKRVGTRAR